MRPKHSEGVARTSRFAAQITPVEAIVAPVLVDHGDAVRIAPFENSVELARRLPDASCERFPERVISCSWKTHRGSMRR